MKYHEELSFGKVEGKEGKYALFHRGYGSGSFGRVFAEINYDRLMGYLDGASFGKAKKEFFLYNGVSSVAREGLFPDLEFWRLESAELEKLLEDSGLSKKFSIKDIKRA